MKIFWALVKTENELMNVLTTFISGRKVFKGFILEVQYFFLCVIELFLLMIQLTFQRSEFIIKADFTIN